MLNLIQNYHNQLQNNQIHVKGQILMVPEVTSSVNIVTILAISDALYLQSVAELVRDLNPRCVVAMFVALSVSLLISN